MFLLILAVNAAGWGIYVLCVMPHHFNYQGVGGSRGLGVGLGVAITAWFLGFRHAFDADHISCIDNTTRKLMADGKRPLGSGFFFSFGHSTIVVAVGVGITFAARAVFGAVVNPSSTFETAGGTAGTLVSAGFLYLIAVLNLIVLVGIFKVFRDMRRGTYDEQELEAQLQARGLMYRFFGRFMKSINHTWQLYFVGLVFGIGFDTATEVVLLSATAYAAIQGLPYYAVLALPFLFSGGMMLFDTLDGCFMNFAYGWAFARPVRKVYYNLVITGLSIGAAFIIGTIEILGLLTTEHTCAAASGRSWPTSISTSPGSASPHYSSPSGPPPSPIGGGATLKPAGGPPSPPRASPGTGDGQTSEPGTEASETGVAPAKRRRRPAKRRRRPAKRRRRPARSDTALRQRSPRRLWLAELGVVNVERLVRDEQEGHVVVLGRAVLHLQPLGEPHEAARAEGTGVRPQNAVEDVHAVGTVVRVPLIGESCEVLHLHHRHTGVWILDELFRREIAVELVNVADLPRHGVGVPAMHLTR